ncbi:ferredoxin [Subtercola lobariae]|uniref:Ferredoxin n=1 Tax=Subtercola lobariae TaxID=1588641 RepID=A0A917EYH5_9MICO|nr:ferredoxin [Subtercola lobariae]GGF24829.1 hypothetical protein GCM10011399_17910 [Subtercola lobariae]
MTNSPQPEPAALLHIDWTRCDGRGLCTELLPELLARDEWGYPLARTGSAAGSAAERSDIAIPPALRGAAADAVALCPRQALKLTSR